MYTVPSRFHPLALPNSPSRVFPPWRFSTRLHPRLLTCNPVLWFPPQRSSGLTFSAEKATLALSRRDHGDGRTPAKQRLPRERRSLRTRPWPYVCFLTHQLWPDPVTVVKATVHSHSHSQTRQQKAPSTPSAHDNAKPPPYHELHSRHQRARTSQISQKNFFWHDHPFWSSSFLYFEIPS